MARRTASGMRASYRRRPAGRAEVVRYYEHLFAHFIPRTRGYRLVEEWVSETSVAQEYQIDVEVDGGGVESHRVIGILVGDGELLGGERIFASERCARLMAGDALIDEVTGGAGPRDTSSRVASATTRARPDCTG